jgi:hypothetical protein
VSERWEIIRDFAGGHNDTASEINVPTREGLHLNTDLDKDGSVSRRKGALKQNDPTFGANDECSLIYQFNPTGGAARLLLAFGQKLKDWNGGAPVDLYTALSNNKILLAVPFRNLLYLSNGVDPLLVYGPDIAGNPKVWKAGVPPPVLAHGAIAKTLDVAGNIAVNGNILVRVRYVGPVDDIHFGEPYPEAGQTIAITNAGGGAGGCRISIPIYPAGAAPDHRVAKRLIERTTVGGGRFFLDGYVNDNVTATYDITQSDAALLANEEMPDVGRRLVPPKLFPIVFYRNRIVGVDVDRFGRLRWSEIDEFGINSEAYPELYFKDLDVQDLQDAPQALAVLEDWLIAYCGRSAHLCDIDDGGEGASNPIAGWEMGVAGPRAVAVLPGAGHLVGTYKGIFLFAAGGPIPVSDKIEKTVLEIPKSKLADMFTLHRYDRRQVVFIVPRVDDVNKVGDRLVYHYRRQTLAPEGFPSGHAWTRHRGSNAKAGTVIRGANGQDIEYTGDYGGFFYQEDTGDSDQHDAAGAISALFKTAPIDCGAPHFYKFFEELWVLVSKDTATDLTLTWETDFGRGGGATVLQDDSNEAEWDTAIWDAFKWAGANSAVLKASLAVDGDTAQGRWITLAFSNQASGQPWQILGVLLKWRPVGIHGGEAT